MTKVLIPIADGVEEIETISMIDVLRRADVEVTVASIKPQGEQKIIGSHGIKLIADTHFDQITELNFDCIAIPGGLPGAKHLGEYQPLLALLKQQKNREGWIAAICAAPAFVLADNGLLEGLKATCYPGFEEKLPDSSLSNEAVVVDGKCITAQGPGKAMAFALKLVQVLCSDEKAQSTQKAMLYTG